MNTTPSCVRLRAPISIGNRSVSEFKPGVNGCVELEKRLVGWAAHLENSVVEVPWGYISYVEYPKETVRGKDVFPWLPDDALVDVVRVESELAELVSKPNTVKKVVRKKPTKVNRKK